MNSVSGFVVIVICCTALSSLSLLFLSTTEVIYSHSPYFPGNQQLLYSNSQVNVTLKNESGGQIGSNIMEHKANVANVPKVAILTFGDGWKSQFTNAKPILDKYGFKASFFVTCDRVGRPSKMTWQDLVTLHNEGHDIESKTMTAPVLTNVSADQLNYEVSQSKLCLASHGLNATVFATPHGKGSNNATVVNAISKYYDLAINGFSNLMFLHCDGWKISSPNQTDCRTYYDNGTLTYANRYVIREWSHNYQDAAYAHNSTKIFQIFVQAVNNQTTYNGNGTIGAIPIVAYHNIAEITPSSSSDTDLALFAKEMECLHDNGFKIIRVTDIGYDDKTQDLYIKR